MAAAVESVNVDVDHCEKTVLSLLAEATKVINDALKEADRATTTKSSYSDLVTETDKKVENILINRLKEIYHDHKFIGEESVDAGEHCTLTDAPTWIIDPIDGTTNFVHGYPYVSISIALALHKQLELGIVHDVFNDKTYIGRRGKGAFCGNEQLRVASVSDITASIIITELGSSRQKSHLDVVLANMKNVCCKARALRCMGSAALNMCMVARGVAHAYYEYGIHCWDIAAGDLIVREAGGVVMDPKGPGLHLMARRVLCACTTNLATEISNNLVHEDLPFD